jgi:methionyl-tRNA synthetase
MFKRSVAQAPTNEREGLVSRLLLRGGDAPGVGLSVAWVEVAGGSAQEVHAHEEEQAYLVVRGRGMMRVGEEEAEVTEGDLVHVPSGVSHGLANASGEERLVYASIAVPASGEEVL